jgi:hypothetical protein
MSWPTDSLSGQLPTALERSRNVDRHLEREAEIRFLDAAGRPVSLTLEDASDVNLAATLPVPRSASFIS